MAYGYKAVLELDGGEPIELDNCSYTYIRKVNEKTGEVHSHVLNGTINIMFTDYPNETLWEWGMKSKFKNGSVKVMQTDQSKGTYIPLEEVTLNDAACVELQLNYSRTSASHFSTSLVITSDESVVGGTDDWVRKEWKLV